MLVYWVNALMEEITSWLDSVKDAPGFRPEVRAAIIILLDEAGQPLYAGLLHLYLGAPHLQDFMGKHLWQGLHEFMKTLAEAKSRLMWSRSRKTATPFGVGYARMPSKMPVP